MKIKSHSLVCFFGIMLFLGQIQDIRAQGTAFTFQGSLNDNGSPATGSYDLRFMVYDSTNLPGIVISGPVTNLATEVTNGLFSLVLDFGPGVFQGSGRWLEMAVRTNGSGSFTTLSPRQPVLPTPYAITAGNLSGSVNASQLTGTLPPTALAGYSGVVTLTNSSNMFAGSFNGAFAGSLAGVTNQPGLLAWQSPAAAAFQAVPNAGYLLTNSQPVTITLPASANVGDIIRISGAGAGGWKIAQNAGQFILGGSASGGGWMTALVSDQQWTSVAASADGTKLVAVSMGGVVATSTNSGGNWALSSGPTTNLFCVAASADGAKLVTAAGFVFPASPNLIFTSTNFGATWKAANVAGNLWFSVASSADGTRLAAAGNGDGVNPGNIFLSTNSGTTWGIASAPGAGWSAVASSADGSKLVGGAGPFGPAAGGPIYLSTNFGKNWTPANVSSNFWNSISSSADGSKLAAAATGGIYVSLDSGTTWVLATNAPILNWVGVASSADGTRLVVAPFGNQNSSVSEPLFISADSGVNWTAADALPRIWSGVASSADGSRLAAVANDGTIMVYRPNSTAGTAGYLAGGQASSVELQYTGNGGFMVISSAGSIVNH
jgi:hypothetical protein